MIFTSPKTASRRNQQGFALMMVMLLTSLVLLSAIVAAPYVRTERQREKEEEMIWRGKQYVRGVKLFYRKNGRFPTSVDDLIKPKVGSVRYMRQAYKDPMNKEDGAWRMIYVGPGGQLIGSLKPPQTFQIPGIAGTQPGTPAGGNAQQGNANNFGLSGGFGQSTSTNAGTAQGGTNASGQPNSAANGQAGSTDADDAAANATPSGLVNGDSPLIGGNIIGVGSKINKRSVIVYDKAKNYRLFEFIWNPSKDLANALNQAGAQVGAPNPNRQGTGQSGFGQSAPAPSTNPITPPNEMPMPSPPPNPPQR
jgi:hypothetical protein